MSHLTQSESEAVERISRHDSTLLLVDLTGKQLTDSQLAELVDCLLAHPNVVTHVKLGGNKLTDETGVKLARYLATSSTLQCLDLTKTRIGLATYLALAVALRVNSSLEALNLFGNQAVDQTRIDAAFVDALRLNPKRRYRLYLVLYAPMDDYERLKHAAKQLGHPSLQLLLAARLTDSRPTLTLHH